MIADFRGMRVTVQGLGVFGGGVGVIEFLAKRGALVTVTDVKSADVLADSLKKIEGLPNVTLQLGGHTEREFREAEVLVVNPGVPKSCPFMNIARDRGIPLTSEMNLFWERNRGRTVGITGSNGKSTTTALVHAILAAGAGLQDAAKSPTDSSGSGKVWLGGNIGKSLLPIVDDIAPGDWVVLELSSFQLDDLAPLEPKPDVAIVTNFSPNHLDRHGTVEAYRAAKQNLLRWQTPEQIAVLNQNDPDVSHWSTKARTFWFGQDDEGRRGLFAVGFEQYKRRALFRSGMREQVLPLGNWLKLPGRHNFQNALVATCAALVLGSSLPQVERGLSGFQGLPHRLQQVVESGERVFVNDSKATTPEATSLALKSFLQPIVLLAGGYDKRIDLSPLARAIVGANVRAVALMGQTGPTLEKQIRELDSERRLTTKSHVTLDGAFAWATAQSLPGDVILLSPGCASYDWFRNYELRGEAFVWLARDWQPPQGTSRGPI
jgi:UDP-N-acetylmuramoylalanine--D-glutamate ligase